jgi:replicative DNA helicase
MTPEELVIGACLLTPDSVRFASSILEPADFRSSTHAHLFHAIVQLQKAGEPVEPFSVWTKAEELGARGIGVVELHEMLQRVGSSESISYYADQVKEATKPTTRHRLRRPRPKRSRTFRLEPVTG